MKLPVFQTFSNAFGFATSNFLTCFRLAWLPFTLLFLAQQFLERAILKDMWNQTVMLGPHTAPRNFFHMLLGLFQKFASIQIGMVLLQALVIAAVAVSFHRIILFGDRREGSIVNFAFGKTEFLYTVMAVGMALITLTLLSSILVPTVYMLANGDFSGLLDKMQDVHEKMPKLPE